MSVIRKTKTVKLILKEFNDNKEAISAIKLIEKFKGNMDKTTVYRILDRLEDSEILHSFIDNDGYRRYAKNESQLNTSSELGIHPHFLCEIAEHLHVFQLQYQFPIFLNILLMWMMIFYSIL